MDNLPEAPELSPLSAPRNEIVESHSLFWSYIKNTLVGWLNSLLPLLNRVDGVIDLSHWQGEWDVNKQGGYAKLDTVSYNSATYFSLVDNNTHAVTDSNYWKKLSDSMYRVNDLIEMREVDTSPDLLYVTNGRYGSHYFKKVDSGTDNDGTVIVLNNGDVYELVYDEPIDLLWFGAKADGVTDDYNVLNKVLGMLSAGDTLDGRGRTYAIGTSLHIPNKVNLHNIKLQAKNTTGSSAILVFDGDAGNAFNVTVDCTSSDLKGIFVTNAKVSFFDKITVLNHKDDGITLDSGYEFTLTNFKTIGRRKTAGGLAHNKVAGVVCNTSDSTFSLGSSERAGIGMLMVGGNNRVSQVHNWGMFGNNEHHMGFGFKILGQTNVFSQCLADGIDCYNTSESISETNGGFGFHISTNGVRTSLVQCKIYQPNFAGHPYHKIVAIYAGKAYCKITDFQVRDEANSIPANPYMFPYETFIKNVDRLQDYVLSPKNITPYLGVDGNYNDTSYILREGHYWEINNIIELRFHFSIDSLGGRTGAITMTGLPYSAKVQGTAWNYFGTGFIDTFGPITSKLYPPTNTIYLFKNDGTLLTDADLPFDKNINIVLSYTRHTDHAHYILL